MSMGGCRTSEYVSVDERYMQGGDVDPGGAVFI